MVVSQMMINKITDLSNKLLASGKTVSPDDLKTAVVHVRWLCELGENERAKSWHAFYKGRFKKIGVEMPEMGCDLRALTSATNAREGGAGRPSTRPGYCTHAEVNTCQRCPARWGRWWDCTGRPVSGSWGVSVVDSGSGKEVRHQKPAPGSKIRGCYFGGGAVYMDGKKTVVPRGVSARHVEIK